METARDKVAPKEPEPKPVEVQGADQPDARDAVDIDQQEDGTR